MVHHLTMLCQWSMLLVGHASMYGRAVPMIMAGRPRHPVPLPMLLAGHLYPLFSLDFVTAGHATPPRDTTAQLTQALILDQTPFRAPCLSAQEPTPGLCCYGSISMLTAKVIHDVNLSDTTFGYCEPFHESCSY